MVNVLFLLVYGLKSKAPHCFHLIWDSQCFVSWGASEGQGHHKGNGH